MVNRKNYELLIWTGEDPRKAPGDWADRQFIVLLSKDEKDFLTSALQGAERAGEIQDFMISEYVAEEDLDDLVHELRKMGLGRFFSRKHWGPR